MRFRIVRSPYGWAFVGALAAILLLLGPSLASPGSDAPLGPSRDMARPAATVPSVTLAALATDLRVPVADSAADQVVPGSVPLGPAVVGRLTVVVTLRYSNSSRLSSLLAALAVPRTARAPSYLSAAMFDREFGPDPSDYRLVAAYFASFGVSQLSTFADRTTITFTASPTQADAIFGGAIDGFEREGRGYLAPTGPISLPAPVAAQVVQVEGLSTAATTFGEEQTLGRPSASVPTSIESMPSARALPTPVKLGGAQIVYAPDFQVAYDEETLLGRFGDPTDASVALLTSGGEYTGSVNVTACGGPLDVHEAVGGWVPADLASYFATILPSKEATPVVEGVPIDGAVGPGCLASWDGTGTTSGNTVDLETIGAMAPGATIYGVYGPTSSEAALDTAFATALDPGSSVNASDAAGLANLSVIATPFGYTDTKDASWAGSLEQAAARGITVLAPTGNSGDDPASQYWVGSQAEFPASMAYTNYGTVAVGGTTVTLNPATDQISTQTAWYVGPKDVALGGPAGSAGGASQVFRQPGWQVNSSAGALLGSLGRGVPDLAGVANDTAATVSVDGYRFEAANASAGGRFFNASGTGLAVSFVAGEVAETDHALVAAGAAALGLAAPTLYTLANLEYAPQPDTKVHFVSQTGSYDSMLPMLPFRDVVKGKNFAWPAGTGYDLVTGWGSLDAYNLTMYLVSPISVPAQGPLAGIQDWVNLTGLGVETPAPGASVQQNLFLANALGAPVIWIQSVLYLSEKPSGAWTVNFTAAVVFPYWGLYPNQSLYDLWFPATGKIQSLPTAWDLTAVLTPGSPSWDSSVTFSFGNGVTPIVLPAPGAAYMLGGSSATYNWQGTTYTDGPRGPVADVPGFLTPQVGLYGYPGGGTSSFTSTTAGTIESYVEPLGADRFVAAKTGPVTLANTQTGEVAKNLSYTQVTPNVYAIGYRGGSNEQGITVAVPYPYPVEFTQTGAPTGTTWTVSLTDGPRLTASAAAPNQSASLENGTYHWAATISSANYSAAVANGTFTVDGAPVTVPLSYYARTDSVSFTASGAMGFPFAWTVKIADGPTLSGSKPLLETNLTYATYDYEITWTNHSWAPSRTAGSFVIGPSPAEVSVEFALLTFDVKFQAVYGIGVFVRWSVTLDGSTKDNYVTKALVFPLPNGTYTYSVGGLPAGYHAVPSSGTVVVHGNPSSKILVTIVAPPRLGGPFGLGIYGYVLIGGILAAAALLLIFVRRRRRRRAAQKAAAKAKAKEAGTTVPTDQERPSRRPAREERKQKRRDRIDRPRRPKSGSDIPPEEL